MSLSSGSSGNCYYLEAGGKAILIDAGIPVRTIQKNLRDNGLSFEKVMGLLITHDHTDHIRSAGSIGEIYHIPVYATKAVHGGMERNFGMSKKLTNASRRNLERDVETLIPGTFFKVTPFMVPHDSNDNVGYYIEVSEEGEEPVKFCLVTDCGIVTDEIRHYLSMADHVVVESNHDLIRAISRAECEDKADISATASVPSSSTVSITSRSSISFSVTSVTRTILPIWHIAQLKQPCARKE